MYAGLEKEVHPLRGVALFSAGMVDRGGIEPHHRNVEPNELT